ncbi:hypothetical protein ACJX0J_025762, partial [Zea mays]
MLLNYPYHSIVLLTEWPYSPKKRVTYHYIKNIIILRRKTNRWEEEMLPYFIQRVALSLMFQNKPFLCYFGNLHDIVFLYTEMYSFKSKHFTDDWEVVISILFGTSEHYALNIGIFFAGLAMINQYFVYLSYKFGRVYCCDLYVNSRALAKLGPARIQGRSSPKRIEGPDGRNLQLQFRSQLALPIFTGGKVEGEQGAAIHVVLLDANTGCVVTSGPESFAKLDILVLEGDFSKEEDEDWTEEEFESNIVKEREGKRPLLTGDLQVTLKEGVGTIGELTFTDNSSWIRSRKFRLGLRIAPGFCEGIRVREAKTEAFPVKDHRGELYKKHYPPALKDDVWRLEKIGKDGAFHKKLNASGIYTVEDFLRLLVRDQQRLRSILGSGMSNKMWDSLVEHAKTCVLSGKHYVYYARDSRNVGAIFNNIYEFTGLIADDQFISAENLTDNQKVYADALVKKAYEDWMQVVEYDGKALLSFKQKKKTVTTRSDVASASTSNPASYGSANSQKQLSLPAKAGQTSSAGTMNE